MLNVSQTNASTQLHTGPAAQAAPYRSASSRDEAEARFAARTWLGARALLRSLPLHQRDGESWAIAVRARDAAAARFVALMDDRRTRRAELREAELADARALARRERERDLDDARADYLSDAARDAALEAA